MDVRTRSVKGRRFWRASGGHLAVITVALQLPFFGNGFRSKPLGKIRRWSPQGSLSLYSTSSWQLLRRRWCQTVMALPFLWIHHRRGEVGGGGGGVEGCMGNSVSPTYHCSGLHLFNHLHLLPHLERRFQLRHPYGHNTGSNRYLL